jgi:RHS repeat-associated protein
MDGIGQVKRNGTTLTRYYYLKDHIGSIKMIVNANGSVDSYNDYYPFGMVMNGRSGSASADARFKFTGKERDTETGWDDFGARYYDARIGRWLQVDPMTEKYPFLSPYNYVDNSPPKYIDRDGKRIVNPYTVGSTQYRMFDNLCSL